MLQGGIVADTETRGELVLVLQAAKWGVGGALGHDRALGDLDRVERVPREIAPCCAVEGGALHRAR